MTRSCPFQLPRTACSGCMYDSSTSDVCLHGKGLSVEDFAKAKGVSKFQVEKIVTASTRKVQAGLMFYSYAEWVRLNFRSEVTPLPEVLSLTAKSPYSDMGVTGCQFTYMMRPEIWEQFCKRREISMPLHEVLLMTEWQLEEILASSQTTEE